MNYFIKRESVSGVWLKLDMDEVVATIKQRPPMQTVIINGRGTKPELVEIADTVSEIAAVKHAFKALAEFTPRQHSDIGFPLKSFHRTNIAHFVAEFDQKSL